MGNKKQCWIAGCIGLVGFCLAANANVARAQTPNVTVKIKYKDKAYYGKPLAWDGKQMMLLRRDGRTNRLPCRSERDFRQVDDKFVPYTRDQLRLRLQREFGSKYQVSMTQNFAVVHPPGDYQKWAQPFETHYSRFKTYFSSRGLRLERLQFPMIAVVLRTRHEFDRFLKTYHQSNKQNVGYYSPNSNRIITFDQSAGRVDGAGELMTASTIVHEAAHQTAFNTGIHNRFGQTPRWICEGLATMFEAKGVNNSASYPRESDRIKGDELQRLKHYYARGEIKGKLAALVSGDRMFESDPELAYALSWGLSFYLVEKRPQAYFRFLDSDRRRRDFTEYSPQDRLANFAKAFGTDFAGIESQIERYIKTL